MKRNDMAKVTKKEKEKTLRAVTKVFGAPAFRLDENEQKTLQRGEVPDRIKRSIASHGSEKTSAERKNKR